MELILDSANVNAIKDLNELLNITGVTTNPTIITKSGKEFDVIVKELIEVLNDDQLLFIQVVATTCEKIVEEAKYICNLRSRNMYAKIPVTHEGLKAIKECKKLGLGVLATAIYSADQAFLAALSGADYLAPYVNRMDNYGDGVANVIDLIEMLNINAMSTKIIAASFKNTNQVHELITAGIHAVTIPIDVAYNMINHPGTKIAIEEFSDNWNRTYHRSSLIK